MSDLNELPETLRKHHQLELASCAVSAFECIAKLHGFIRPETFPLQTDPANQKKGFGETGFLKSFGLVPSELHLSVSDAVDLIEAETKEGRFPLAVQIVGRNSNEFEAHTFVCALHDGNILLIDPAFPKIQVEGKDKLAKEFESKIQQFPVRDKIHVLTYSK